MQAGAFAALPNKSVAVFDLSKPTVDIQSFESLDGNYGLIAMTLEP
jgi:hypothetical protein